MGILCIVRKFFAVGQFAVRKKTFFLNANCPTAKEPRATLYVYPYVLLDILLQIITYFNKDRTVSTRC